MARLTLALFLLAAVTSAQEDLAPKLRAALVKIQVTTQSWDTTEPWKKRPVRSNAGRGVVIEPGVVLTLANLVNDQQMIEVSRAGAARLYPARLKHVDAARGLALIEITDEKLRAELKPLPLGEPVKLDDEFDIWGLNQDNLLQRASARVVAANAMSTRLMLKVNTTASESGNGQVALKDGKIVGLLTGSIRRQEGTILAVETIRAYLDDFKDGKYDGCPGPSFWFQTLLRDDLRKYYGLSDEQHGIALTRIMPGRSGDGVLKDDDVLLSVDGHDVDDEGKYIDPVHGRLSVGYLLRGQRCAGDKIKATVWRDGKEVPVEFTLKSFPASEMRVPDKPAGDRPQFLVEGGLVILELTGKVGIGRSTGGVILRRYRERATWDPPSDRRRIVYVDKVLQDPSNKGLEDIRHAVIETVNGQPIHEIADVEKALEKPQGDFHVFHFEGVETDFVIPVAKRDAINQRIAKTYKVTRTRYLHGDPE